MASRAQIGRLAQRIEQVAKCLMPSSSIKWARIIHDPRVDESEEAAFERHFAEHPEDRAATNFIVIRVVDPRS